MPRKSKKGRKAKYNVKTSKLRDKKINTLIERRIQEIAKKEDAVQRINLIKRQFWYCGQPQDPNHQQMVRSHNKYAAGAQVFYNGLFEQIGELEKVDINQVVNAPRAFSANEFAYQEQDGVNVGMATAPQHGRRLGDQIKISGWTLGMKVLFPAVQTLQQDHQIIGGINDPEVPPTQPPDVPRQIETVVLKYAIVGIMTNTAVQGDQGADPTPADLLTYRSWGYSPLLDFVEGNVEKYVKRRTFVKGELKCNLSTHRNKDMTTERYVKLKSPLTVKYDPNDQNGTRTGAWRFFLVLRSNVPHTSGTFPAGAQPYDYSAYAPRVSAFTKMHYFE